MNYAIDHLVLGCLRLDDGAVSLAQTYALNLTEGGQHLHMGTHNRLLNLADGQTAGAYLELIAIDPALPVPPTPRWFGLDHPAVIKHLAHGPRPLAWVVRVDNPETLDQLHADYPDWVGPPQTQSRGDLSWRIAVPRPDTGGDTRRFGGLMPVFIAWSGAVHPTRRLPVSAWRLERLSGTHPQATEVQAALDTLGVGHLIELSTGPSISLQFSLRHAHQTVDLT